MYKRQPQSHADGVHYVVMRVTPFEVRHVVVQRVSVEVVYLRQMFRVGNERLGYQTMRVAVSYTHLDVYKRQVYRCVVFQEIIGSEQGFYLRLVRVKVSHEQLQL